MNYYILKPAVDTQETGNAYPAVESYPDYDFKAPNSVHKLNFREFPDFTPDIRFKLAKGAKLCDMMGQAAINAHGLLIGEKLKPIFESFSMVPHRFYPATIEDKGILHNYYWMHLVWNESLDVIDYAKSTFFIRRGLRNIGKIEVNSFDDFMRKNNEMGAVNYIDYDQIFLKVPIAFDIFPIYHGIDIFISEAMTNALRNHRFSGIDISSTNKIL